MKPSARIASLLFATIFVSAMSGDCQQDGIPAPNENPCALGIPSLILVLQDVGGATLRSAQIGFRLNGSDPIFGGCNGDCNRVILANDTIGRFDYSVGSPGYVSQTGTAIITAAQNGCSPITVTRQIALEIDTTIGVLNGAWISTNIAGQSIIVRFDAAGRPIGAMLTQQRNTGDGNIYIEYNNNEIKGAPNQPVMQGTAPLPARSGNILNWGATTGGYVVGFDDAVLSGDNNSLTGKLLGSPIAYSRMVGIPTQLSDP